MKPDDPITPPSTPSESLARWVSWHLRAFADEIDHWGRDRQLQPSVMVGKEYTDFVGGLSELLNAIGIPCNCVDNDIPGVTTITIGANPVPPVNLRYDGQPLKTSER